MIKIAVCDDNVQELEITTKLVEEYHQKKEVFSFNSPSQLLEVIGKGEKFDIYILDIVMPGMNGIELGEGIRKIDFDARIILLTTSKEYGVESYSIKATDYVLKPCTKERLFATLDGAIKHIINQREKRFVINISGGVYALPFSKLLYIEYYDHRLRVYTTEGEKIESVTYRKSFGTLMEPLIESGQFVQVAASFVINMQYVKKLKTNEFEIRGGKTFNISRTYLGSRSIYMDYVLGKR